MYTSYIEVTIVKCVIIHNLEIINPEATLNTNMVVPYIPDAKRGRIWVVGGGGGSRTPNVFLIRHDI